MKHQRTLREIIDDHEIDAITALEEGLYAEDEIEPHGENTMTNEEQERLIGNLCGQVTALRAMTAALVVMHPERDSIRQLLAQEIADQLDHKDKEYLLGMKQVHQHLCGMIESVQGSLARITPGSQTTQ